MQLTAEMLIFIPEQQSAQNKAFIVKSDNLVITFYYCQFAKECHIIEFPLPLLTLGTINKKLHTEMLLNSCHKLESEKPDKQFLE